MTASLIPVPPSPLGWADHNVGATVRDFKIPELVKKHPRKALSTPSSPLHAHWHLLSLLVFSPPIQPLHHLPLSSLSPVALVVGIAPELPVPHYSWAVQGAWLSQGEKGRSGQVPCP